MIQYRCALAALWIVGLVMCARPAALGAASTAPIPVSDAGEDAKPTAPAPTILVAQRIELRAVDSQITQHPSSGITAGHGGVSLPSPVGYRCSWFVDLDRTVPSLFHRFSYRTTGPPLQLT